MAGPAGHKIESFLNEIIKIADSIDSDVLESQSSTSDDSLKEKVSK